jgi:hypothetical protein
MEPTIRELTIRGIHDALAIAGPSNGGGGFIRTARPADYMDDDRERIALAVLKRLPKGTTAATAEQLADVLVPVVRGVLAQ